MVDAGAAHFDGVGKSVLWSVPGSRPAGARKERGSRQTGPIRQTKAFARSNPLPTTTHGFPRSRLAEIAYYCAGGVAGGGGVAGAGSAGGVAGAGVSGAGAGVGCDVSPLAGASPRDFPNTQLIRVESYLQPCLWA